MWPRIVLKEPIHNPHAQRGSRAVLVGQNMTKNMTKNRLKTPNTTEIPNVTI